MGSPRRKCARILVVLAAVAAATAGCGNDDSAPTGPATERPTGSSSSSSGPTASTALLRAGRTALGEVDGGTVISIETEDGGRWEIQVSTADGVEHELDVSADGGSMLRGPTTKREDARDRAKHRARLQAAKLDYRAAVRALGAEVPGGRVVELNLDDYRGQTVWEGDLVTADGTKHAVKIDAADGHVVAKNLDDTDDD